MQALLHRFPGLSALPYWPLCTMPTPVTEHVWNERMFLVKRDDLTSPRYGGNKVRKLAFLLGDLRERGIHRLTTVGAIGSNHCLATAIHAGDAGFDVELRQMPQPVTEHVSANLRHLAATSATLRLSAGPVGIGVGLALDHAVKTDWAFVPAGGSNTVGCLGYVDAALELAQQIEAQLCPAPTRIFVALGSGATQAGLVAGLHLARLAIPVVGVRVVPGPWIGARRVAGLANAALKALRQMDRGVAGDGVEPGDILIDDAQLGAGYGHPTAAGAAAEAVMRDLCLPTDPTYTSKAFAAMMGWLSDGHAGRALFWETLSGAELDTHAATSGADLPTPYQQFLSRETP